MLALLLLLSPAQAGDFLDAAFASDLCTAWNDAGLPDILGRDGSGWIDSAGSTGHQVMVMNRRDCDGWAKVQLTVDADASGRAVCTAGGAFTGGEFQWKFEPTTLQWIDFSDGFGVMDMPGIMSGFVGPYGTAASNIKSFERFFAAAGRLGFDQGASFQCTGTKPEKVDKVLAKVDHEDNREILE